MEKPNTPVFNKLSRRDRLTLISAAVVEESSRFARDDTIAHPWRASLYLGIIAFIAAPIPLPGANIGPLLLIAGMAATRLTPWARRADDLRRSFNSAAVMEKYSAYVTPDPDRGGAFRVRSMKLAADSGRRVMGHTYDIARAGWRGLKRQFS